MAESGRISLPPTSERKQMLERTETTSLKAKRSRTIEEQGTLFRNSVFFDHELDEFHEWSTRFRSRVDKLREMHPGIQSVGWANGYVKPEEMDALIDEINLSEADILFVAEDGGQRTPRLNTLEGNPVQLGREDGGRKGKKG